MDELERERINSMLKDGQRLVESDRQEDRERGEEILDTAQKLLEANVMADQVSSATDDADPIM
jgi:hypothetical protein